MTIASLDGEIHDHRHHMQVRVYFEDTDAIGIVYHASYLRFMERGRTNHLRLLGAAQAATLQRPNEITPSSSWYDNVGRDFSGIVYHANYLRFMERGRTNHLRLMGADQHALFTEEEKERPGFAFVVRSMQIDFLKPARMDDVLDVVTWPVAVKGASIVLAQEIRRGSDVLVRAQVRVAFISEGRAQPIPKELRSLLKADLA